MTTEPETTEPDTLQLEATEPNPAPYDDPLLDEEWLAAPQRRSRLRTLLVLLLGASLLFLAGTQAQRQFGPSSSAGTATAFSPPGGAAPSGFPGGARPGGAGTGSGDSGTGASAGAGAGAGTGDVGSTSTSALIGTVVSIKGDRWTVKDLGGKTHVVRVPTGTQVVRETPVAANKVARGATVDISGSTTGGSLSASAITVR